MWLFFRLWSQKIFIFLPTLIRRGDISLGWCFLSNYKVIVSLIVKWKTMLFLSLYSHFYSIFDKSLTWKINKNMKRKSIIYIKSILCISTQQKKTKDNNENMEGNTILGFDLLDIWSLTFHVLYQGKGSNRRRWIVVALSC